MQNMFVFPELDTSLLRYKLKILLEGRALILIWEFSEVQIKRKKEILSSSKNTLPTKTLNAQSYGKREKITRLEKIPRLLCLRALLAGPAVVDCFLYPPLKDANRFFLTGQGQTSFMILCNQL